jgi:rod shape determining protein RodA
MIGWLMLYAATSGAASFGNFSLNSQVGRQTIWIGLSLLAFLGCMFIDPKFWMTFSFIFYAIGLVLLILVLFFGDTIKGSTSWFSFFGFSFQPSELAKLGTIFALSSYLSYHKTDLNNIQNQLISIALILAPIILIFLQPDAGSGLVFLSFAFLLFREGLNPWYFIIGFSAALFLILPLIFPLENTINGILLVVAIVLAFLQEKRRSKILFSIIIVSGALLIYYQILEINLMYFLIGAAISNILWQGINHKIWKSLIAVPICALAIGISFSSSFGVQNYLKPHQQDRINVWLNPSKSDPHGSFYNVLQSKIAISSGGLEGKGFLNGTMTKHNYVPEQSTDFIFSTIGEEQGFLGVFGVIALFLFLFLRIIAMAERAKVDFYRHFAYGVLGIFVIHFFINIAMTMNIMPVVGIPLPFISKGGSSLFIFTIMLALVLKMDTLRRT